LQSKSGRPLGRYFPDLVEAFKKLPAERFVIDGEIVIPVGGRLSFDELLMRVHPAESRVRKLAATRFKTRRLGSGERNWNASLVSTFVAIGR
jgi:ATP-dependent DNA ligase